MSSYIIVPAIILQHKGVCTFQPQINNPIASESFLQKKKARRQPNAKRKGTEAAGDPNGSIGIYGQYGDCIRWFGFFS